MSRTRHRIEDRPERRSSRPKLTKGKGASMYTPSSFDEPANRGKNGSWQLWLNSFCGYQKQYKRRQVRKFMKRYGRRVERRKKIVDGIE